VSRIEEIQRDIQESEDFNSPIKPYGIDHDKAMALSRHIDALTAERDRYKRELLDTYTLLQESIDKLLQIKVKASLAASGE
jgi:hypothetical protein